MSKRQPKNFCDSKNTSFWRIPVSHNVMQGSQATKLAVVKDEPFCELSVKWIFLRWRFPVCSLIIHDLATKYILMLWEYEMRYNDKKASNRDAKDCSFAIIQKPSSDTKYLGGSNHNTRHEFSEFLRQLLSQAWQRSMNKYHHPTPLQYAECHWESASVPVN